MNPLHPETLTWTALLTKWVDFAQASLAIPTNAEGDRWRASVVAVINLQAVTFALADLAQLPSEDRPHGRDKAEVLIRENVIQLEEVWRSAPMPETLLEICSDARAALELSVYAGVIELIHAGPGIMVMPTIAIDDNRGTLAIMQPGTLIMPGEPVGWWVDRDGKSIAAALPDCVRSEPHTPRQVYRQIDDAGLIVKDIIAPIDADLPPGMPLLVPLFEQGRPVGHFTLDAEEWEARQRAAMSEEIIPVETVPPSA